jgi:hypothetical protein
MSRWVWSTQGPKKNPDSIRSRCAAAGVPYSTVRTRMVEERMTLEEALAAPRRGHGRRTTPPPPERRRPYSEHERFWDYLRMALGLDPLYHLPRTDDELAEAYWTELWGTARSGRAPRRR